MQILGRAYDGQQSTRSWLLAIIRFIKEIIGFLKRRAPLTSTKKKIKNKTHIPLVYI